MCNSSLWATKSKGYLKEILSLRLRRWWAWRNCNFPRNVMSREGKGWSLVPVGRGIYLLGQDFTIVGGSTTCWATLKERLDARQWWVIDVWDQILTRTAQLCKTLAFWLNLKLTSGPQSCNFQGRTTGPLYLFIFPNAAILNKSPFSVFHYYHPPPPFFVLFSINEATY